MKQRLLGKSGIRVSEIGLGCWQLGGDFGPLEHDRARRILQAAVECGINLWDTADVYGSGRSERRIGEFISRSASRPVIATKVGRDGALYPNGYTKERVRTSIEGSARRLQVEAIDLVQLHCIPPEVLEAGEIFDWLEEFRKLGLIRAFGASVETLREAKIAMRSPALTSLQIIFNIFRQNAISELFPLAEARGVGIVVRLPLASGVLSGGMSLDRKFAESDHRHYNRDGAAFSQGQTFSGIPFATAVGLAERIGRWLPEGMTMAQMAIRWILDQPATSTVIAGASRPEQVVQNASAGNLDPLPEALHRKLADFYRRDVEPAICVPI